MTADDYLDRVLAAQTFGDEDFELKALRQHRKDIEALLNSSFEDSDPSIRWAGSMAKHTMIRTSYDGDVTCYFKHDETIAGSTLQELYEACEKALRAAYDIERKPSAIRVRERGGSYLHLDLVPGRFTDESEADVFLHRTTGDKQRLKTNLDVHIEHIRDSGVRPAIRLMKLWRVRNGLSAKTFILELLVVKLLAGKKCMAVSEQLKAVWTAFRDEAEELSVEDPANPSGNDLKPALDETRSHLSSVAGTTLAAIESSGWEAVFGPLDGGDGERGSRVEVLRSAAASVSRPTKPWLPEE